jgi:hypothetical protein
MAQTFFPVRSILVDSSYSTAIKNAQYKVSRGIEIINNEERLVKKIQMVVDGQVLGNVVPSFPLGSDDFKKIDAAMNALDEAVGVIEPKAFREAVIIMSRNLGYKLDMKRMYGIAENISNDPAIYEIIESHITSYFGNLMKEETK